MSLIDDLKKWRDNYQEHPLDSGLKAITIGTLAPALVLIRFPIITVEGRAIYAGWEDMLVPIGALVFASIYRWKQQGWAYWMLLIATLLMVLVNVGGLFTVLLGDDGTALSMAPFYVDNPNPTSASYGTKEAISASATAVGASVAAYGFCLYFRVRRQGRAQA